MAKHIFVTGGVVSSLGKGITAASLGRLLKCRGFNVSIQKLDPYLNVDPGTMSPFQHGEVFVTEDGTETDLDLGHYERFIDENLKKESNVTAGSVYWSVLTKERKGEFLGATVQIIPHITNEIKQRVIAFAKQNDTDIAITEVGGTVGDIEGLSFLEAIRQFKKDIGERNVLYIHVTLIPYLDAPQELKTKPTQHSVKELRAIGIQPDIIVCRSDRPLDSELKRKIALFCDVEPASVISAVNLANIYEIPLEMHDENLDKIVVEKLRLKRRRANLKEWKELVQKSQDTKSKVCIAIVGKYVKLKDAYISIVEALKHASIFNRQGLEIHWVDTDRYTPAALRKELKKADGILVPGGFGVRGIEGKINAINYARQNKVPFLGICLGMQCAVIEFARNAASLKKANSSEFDSKTPYPVIDLMPEQKGIENKGGTMRLGSYPCKLENKSKAYQAYGKKLVAERHRHRYELNNSYRKEFSQNGMMFSGISPDGKLVEIIELKSHPWFVAAQFHPEFKSRPVRPHPLFRDFIGAAMKERRKKK